MKRGVCRLLLVLFAVACVFSTMCGAMAASNADGEVVIDVYADYQRPQVETADDESIESSGALTVIEDINGAVNDFAWGPVMLVLLVGTGVWFTVRTKGFQFKYFGHMWRNTIGKVFKKSEGITPSQYRRDFLSQ